MTPIQGTPGLEVCVDDVAGLEAAVQGGADRIELCSALSLGGLTPSAGLMAAAARLSIPVFALIRPRPGHFVFSPAERQVMLRDIDAARTAGLAGVVLGAQTPEGVLDEPTLTALLDAAEGLGTTLHRAIDLCPDPLAAVDTAVALGFDRVLSSGGARTATEGARTLAAMVRRAAGRLSVMPGSGVTAQGAAALLTATGAKEVHSSCSRVVPEDERLVRWGFSASPRRVTDPALVAELRAALDQLPRNLD